MPRNDAILVLNAGSSSLKFSIYELVNDTLALKARGQIEGLGSSPHLKMKDERGNTLADKNLEVATDQSAHVQAFTHLSAWAKEHFGESLMPVAVGHRLVHGGAEFAAPVRVDDQVMKKLEALVPLAPLHQPHNLEAIKAVTHLRPDLPQVACFDTAFHRGRSSVAERFGLPDQLYQQGVRRWGFHGLSYEFIASQFRKIAPDVAKGRVIVAHLGSGASLCAMKDGRSVDTTMGFSTLDGVPMGTRCGSLDPGVILFLLNDKSPDEIEALLYKKSGLLGISGVSNDVRELLASSAPLAAEAIEYFVFRAAKEIGALTAALGGLDALIFTAGIGENSPVIRERIGARLEWLGVAIDEQANQKGGGRISLPDRSPSVWVIPTDEERVIAKGTLRVLVNSREG